MNDPCGGPSWRAPSDASETWSPPSAGEMLPLENVDLYVDDIYMVNFVSTYIPFKKETHMLLQYINIMYFIVCVVRGCVNELVGV